MIIDGRKLVPYDEMEVEMKDNILFINGIKIKKTLDKKNVLCYNDIIIEEGFI